MSSCVIEQLGNPVGRDLGRVEHVSSFRYALLHLKTAGDVRLLQLSLTQKRPIRCGEFRLSGCLIAGPGQPVLVRFLRRLCQDRSISPYRSPSYYQLISQLLYAVR